MISLRMRPAFERHLSCSPNAAVEALQTHVEQSDDGYHGAFYDKHVVINVPDDEAWFWSPQLSLDLQPENGGTHLRGVYGPRPSVWTMFMAMYALAAFAAFLGGVVGGTQWSLGMDAPWLWSIPAGIVLALTTYALALVGQWLSRDQLDALYEYTEQALAAADAPTPAPGT